MLEDLRCRRCHHKLCRISLERHPHVEIKCERCGLINEYDFDPTRYVKKGESPSHNLFED